MISSKYQFTNPGVFIRKFSENSKIPLFFQHFGGETCQLFIKVSSSTEADLTQNKLQYNENVLNATNQSLLKQKNHKKHENVNQNDGSSRVEAQANSPRLIVTLQAGRSLLQE